MMRAVGANTAFVNAFRGNLGEAGQGTVFEERVVRLLNAREASVLCPLTELQDLHARELTRAQAGAKEASNEALVAAIIAGLLAIGSSLGFVLYTLRLVGRVSRREGELAENLGATLRAVVRRRRDLRDDRRAGGDGDLDRRQRARRSRRPPSRPATRCATCRRRSRRSPSARSRSANARRRSARSSS